MSASLRFEPNPAVADLPRPLALVLSGGGAVGAVQVGHLLALRELGIYPDLVVGTSVGAVNGAVVAADPEGGAARLVAIWSRVRRADVFPVQPLHLLASLHTRSAGLLPSRGLVTLVSDHLRETELGRLRVPLHVIATDSLTGDLVDLATGRILDALLASSAIPGVFAPVRIDGRALLDGGLVADLPIIRAFDLGARSAIVLDASGPCEVTRPPETVMEAVAWGLRVLSRSQVDAHLQAAAPRGLIVHLPTPCTTRRSAIDFRGADELIATTRLLTMAFFREQAGQPWPASGTVGRQHRHSTEHACLETA
jgi:NTE family protein